MTPDDNKNYDEIFSNKGGVTKDDIQNSNILTNMLQNNQGYFLSNNINNYYNNIESKLVGNKIIIF